MHNHLVEPGVEGRKVTSQGIDDNLVGSSNVELGIRLGEGLREEL
jgi:hypothetical protein